MSEVISALALLDEIVGLVQTGLPRRAASSPVFRPPGPRGSSLADCDECGSRRACLVCPLALDRASPQGEMSRVPDLLCAFNRVAARYGASFPLPPSLADVLRDRASRLPPPASGP